MKGCKTNAEYAEKLRKARDNLAAFGDTCYLSDVFLINILFNGLGPSYKSFLSPSSANHDIIPTKDEDGIDVKVTTLQGVIAATQREEQQQKKGEIHALIASKSHQAARFTRFCDHCKFPGHTITEPKSLKEAKRDGALWERWKEAMKMELKSLHTNKTWTLCTYIVCTKTRKSKGFRR